MSKAKAIYIAGTRQNEGKTTLALGLIGELVRRGLKVGYIKPVGQQYVEAEGIKVDKDSLLLMRVFSVDAKLADTSPVAVDRQFTRNYIDHPQPMKLRNDIVSAYERVSAGKDIVVVEGTGHAGVGAVIDLSNAQVAALLGAPVIIISSGGIGKPVDEILLNQALFEKEHVKVAGVVLNRVIPDKLDTIADYVARSLEAHGIDLLAVLPELHLLSVLTVRQVARDIGAQVEVGEKYLDNLIERLTVGAMTAHRALDYLAPGVLMITGGDRDDLLLATVGMCAVSPLREKVIAGIILTGGMTPHESVREVIKQACFPVLMAAEDSYTVATRVSNLTAKIQVQDTAKHQLAIQMVRQHVNVDRLLSML